MIFLIFYILNLQNPMGYPCPKICQLRTNEFAYESMVSLGTNNSLLVQQDSIFKHRTPKIRILCLEWLGATIGGAGLGIGFGYLAMRVSNLQDPQSQLGMFLSGGVLGVPIGSAIGAAVTGRILNQKGNFVPSLFWSVVGTVIGVGSYYLIDSYALVGAFILPQTGAVFGYHLNNRTCCGIGNKKIHNINNNICFDKNNATRGCVLKVELVRLKF